MTEIEARLISREQAAKYCGLKTSGFDLWVRRKLLPAAIPGTRRWDRKALDLALDKLSGIEATQPEITESEADRWFRENGYGR